MKNIKIITSIILCVVLIASIVPVSFAEGTRKLYPGEFFSEKDAGILTDADSARIKQIVRNNKNINIDLLLAPYFQKCVREDSAILMADANPTVGSTRFRRTYDNSGIITYQRKYGIWRAIASATIGTVLGTVKDVGSILSFAYSAIGGYEPDYEREAEAKTQYSYRYIEDRGEVYEFDSTSNSYQYATRAISISREKYQHEYGYYINSQGKAKSHTHDYNQYIEYLRSPNAANQGFLKQKAYEAWKNDAPAYYEDWND